MGRIRSIKPEFFTSPDVAALSLGARLTFVGLWCFADDHGRAPAVARLIKATVWPLDDEVGPTEIEAHLDELIRRAMVSTYEVDGRVYLQITNWCRHQRPSHPSPSKLPAPEDARGARAGSRKIPASSPEASASARDASGTTPEDSGARARARNREQGTGNRDHSGAARSRGSRGAAPDVSHGGAAAVRAFVDEARRSGYEPVSSLRGRCGTLAALALAEGIPTPLVAQAAEECARRRGFGAWANVLADLQAGQRIGRPRAPMGDVEPAGNDGVRAWLDARKERPA